MPILTVSQINRYVASILHEDSNLHTVFVRGEIANFTQNFRSGHCYFSIRDEEASVRAVMFRVNAERLSFRPENGLHILAQGSVGLYEREGSFQIQISDMQPDGIGAQALTLQQRREKLAKLGFFEKARKRSLPTFPKKIGIVTSKSGAALQDMLQILRRRYPVGYVHVFPALVQGTEAPMSIAEALKSAAKSGCDVILMGRGGGSNEDLSAFQSEEVATAVFSSPVPVISAVGHETDHCIADDVADLRAPTPSAAAEIAVPDISVLHDKIKALKDRMLQASTKIISYKQQNILTLKSKLLLYSPAQQLNLKQEQLAVLFQRMEHAAGKEISRKERALMVMAGKLESVSPIAVLHRGYALVYHKNILTRDASAVKIGNQLLIRLAKGSVLAQVTDIIEGTVT